MLVPTVPQRINAVMEAEIVLGPLGTFLDGSVQAGDAGQFFQGITAAQMAREQDRSFGSLRGRRMGTPLARHTGQFHFSVTRVRSVSCWLLLTVR